LLPKINIMQKVISAGVVAVIRADSPEKAAKTSEACLEGGVSAVEVTFTTPRADKAIETLKKDFSGSSLILGAGTVLDSQTARIAILAGAEFIVSPAFDLETAKLCNRYQIPYFPGCMTINEIITAMEAGADIVKLFPGNTLGPEFVKAVKGPLPQANIMPTGGVSLNNVHVWIEKGCVAVGVGSELTAGAKTGDYLKVTETAKQFVEKIREARSL